MERGVLQDLGDGAREEAAQDSIHCDIPDVDIYVTMAVLHCLDLTNVLIGH